jgi:hypothetical protein
LPSGEVECTAASVRGSAATPNDPCCSVESVDDFAAVSVVCSCCAPFAVVSSVVAGVVVFFSISGDTSTVFSVFARSGARSGACAPSTFFVRDVHPPIL